MITENAPVFMAAGDGLAANFTLDFTADLQHQLLTRGLWQGEAKDAKSLYIDNYENNFAISIYNGGQVTRCPAYSDGFMDLNASGTAILTAGAGASVLVKMYTEQKAAGFAARGNAPVVSSYVSYTLGGTINFVSGNTLNAEAKAYSSLRDSIFWGTTTNLLIELNCSTKSIAKVVTCAKTITAMACNNGTGKIMCGTSDGFFGIYDPTTPIEPTWISSGFANQINSIVYHPIEDVFYAGQAAQSCKTVSNAAAVLTTIGGAANTAANYLRYSSYDSLVYMLRPGTTQNLYSLTSTTASAGTAIGDALAFTDMVFSPYDNSIYVVTTTSLNYWKRGLSGLPVNQGIACGMVAGTRKMTYDTANNQIYGYTSADNANAYAFSVPLAGNIGIIPITPISIGAGIIYASGSNFIFSYHANALVYWYR